ncbi:tetratricopeptide repeat protein [Paludibaculum fermentans]|uniref:Tetratricopeptide repeat protein n=1 Tax=Paludibaculum fermentans TaxID=1473598 RepID=A0A7S7NLZ6_PALFE|nr:tetratricopeptide repeat protein [Paludibaculum fermentans]QOY86103.1 tetratricopeptide repeat protein [Paludibaculum fermentans]
MSPKQMLPAGWTKAAMVGVLAACGAFGAFAQTPAGGGGGGGSTGGGGSAGGGSGTPTTPTRPSTGTSTGTTGQQNTTPSMMDIQRPIYLSGRLMMDDGSAPPEPVVMLLVCNGQPRPQGYADMKGRFSISLGQNQGVFADASIGNPNEPFSTGSVSKSSAPGMGRNGMTEREMMGCEFKADLPGFRSDVIQLSGRRLLDNPEVGTLVLHRMANVEGFVFSATTGLAPKDAKKAYEKGLDLVKKKKYPEAEVQLQKAVEIYPKYALAWFELGNSLMGQKKADEAQKAWEQSVGADAKFVKPHLQLMQLSLSSKDWGLIASRSDTVLKLDPYSYSQAWFINAAAKYNLKKMDEAEKSAREAVKLDPDHRNPRSAQLLGAILADKGDYPGALEQMKGYLSFAPNAPDVESVRKQVAELERVTGVKSTAQGASTTPAPEKQ